MVIDLLLLLIGVVLTVGTGFFVAAEFSLVNLDRAELEARSREGEPRLGTVIGALKVTSTHLSSAQLGITLTTLLAGYTFEPALSGLIAAPLHALGVADEAALPIAAIAGLLVATLISMILGELLPKNLALAAALPVARVVVPFQVGFTAVFRPAVRLLNSTANLVLHGLGIEPKEELSGARSAQELSSLVRRSALEGVLDRDTATLLERSLNFSGHTAADVMTPRPRLATIARSASAADVLDMARRTGFSRFPVTGEGGVDDVAGVVHVKQAMAVPRPRRAEVPVGAIETRPLRVPETMTLDALLGELRGRGYQMAVVLDEYGGTAGVATLEDLVEELVGDLVDEHDRTRAGVVRSRDSLAFPGILRPDELEDQTGVQVPESGLYETVAGFVVSRLGRLPKVGDTVRVEQGVLEVLRLDGRRIDRLRFRADPDSRLGEQQDLVVAP
ncbi:hemolysin family protein [Amnibacterium sp. CER49]|uniref:hemolysin family protein n=1 Tax=Amnibacterium sp. CER49 TaxID=3039161 RepID=UPI002447DB22|nr:hemolysin family protein [Amnibacterium sp. CER49]MDH2445256.1 hemolysin family protein [Amnibacterium sp. CER49]